MRKLVMFILLATLAFAFIYPINAVIFLSDDFERSDIGSDWNVVRGTWSIDSGELKGDGVDSLLASGLHLTDFSVEVRMKIVTSGGQYRDWVGIVARATNPNDDIWTSGYLVYLREDGRIELYTAADGKLATANTGVDTSKFVTVRAYFNGSNIKVYVNSILFIDVEDNRYSAGYFSLENYVTEGRFDDVLVENPPEIPPFNVVPEPAPVIISLLLIATFAIYGFIRHKKQRTQLTSNLS